jgi:uncharacterized protein (DUF1501 family)
VTGAAALAAGAGGLGLAGLLRSAPERPEDTGESGVGTLVLVTLYGGNDGLNTVIPYADPAYHSVRPELAYAPEAVLRLDDSLGLNPKLPGLKRTWDAGRLAIVLGAGYPRPDRSHFRSMDIWQTASPARPVHTGWVGRWLDGIEAPPEAAVSFEPILPPLLAGETRAGACVGVGRLDLPAGIDPEVVSALGRAAPQDAGLQARAASVYGDLLRVEGLVGGAQDALAAAQSARGTSMVTATTGGGKSLAAQLALVAHCVEAGVPTRVYSVSLGGFDTHAEELAGHESLLGRLDDALAGFVERLGQTPAGRRVAVVVYSEFGRRVRANASDGTDHGTAGPVFVLGPRVSGGLLGEQPSLRDLDDGDLKATVDFRDVFGTLLATVLQADPARYIDGYQVRELPLF